MKEWGLGLVNSQGDEFWMIEIDQTKLAVGGRIAVWLVTSLIRLDLTSNYVEALYPTSESKLVQLEISHTVILPPTVSKYTLV